MTLEWIHPGLVLILGAWVLPILKGRVKRVAMLLVPAAALVDCLLVEFVGRRETVYRAQGQLRRQGP